MIITRGAIDDFVMDEGRIAVVAIGEFMTDPPG
jgi:hypothetical protein